MIEKKTKKIEEKKEIKSNKVYNPVVYGNEIFNPIIYGNDVEEILERDIKKFSLSGAHIIIPKRHEGKHARIIIKRKKEEEK